MWSREGIENLRTQIKGLVGNRYPDKVRLAELAGLSYPAVDNFVTGKTNSPRLPTLEKFQSAAEAFVSSQGGTLDFRAPTETAVAYVEERTVLSGILPEESDRDEFADQADIERSDLDRFLQGESIADPLVLEAILKELSFFAGQDSEAPEDSATAADGQPPEADDASISSASLSERLFDLLQDDPVREERFALLSGLLLSQVRRVSDGNAAPSEVLKSVRGTLDGIDSGEIDLETISLEEEVVTDTGQPQLVEAETAVSEDVEEESFETPETAAPEDSTEEAVDESAEAEPDSYLSHEPAAESSEEVEGVVGRIDIDINPDISPIEDIIGEAVSAIARVDLGLATSARIKVWRDDENKLHYRLSHGNG